MYGKVPQDEKGGGSCNWGRCLGICCGCSCCLSVFLIWGVIPFVAGVMIGYGQFLVQDPALIYEYCFVSPPLNPQTLPSYIWWPGCNSIGAKTPEYLAKCSLPCFSPNLIPAATNFSNMHTWRQVTYPSRTDSNGKIYSLTGWLLPGEKANLAPGHLAPRVAINHGFSSNSNKWALTMSAYYLRSMGFDVLLNNLRGIGYSQNTSLDITTWGYEYHYDLLGAWDYLKADPENILGGPQPATKVGIMGFSMGAFIALNAFTFDQTVPAVWADSPPLSPRDAFLFGAMQSPLAPLLKIPGVGSLTFMWVSNKAGIDLEARTPKKDIPTAPDVKRPVQLAANLQDKTVSADDVKEIASLISQYPNKYNMSQPIYTDTLCNGQNHIVSGLIEPDLYRQRLCEFFTTSLGEPQSICGLANLPKFGSSPIASARRLAEGEASTAQNVVV